LLWQQQQQPTSAACARGEDTNTETKKEKKAKNKRKNKIKSGDIGISPFSHSMMLPGYTNLEASSDGILLFIRHTLTINS
jgi:hypothetical protein